MHQGLFIAIEGSDGSGKATQFKLLEQRLKAEGYDVATYDFPQYDSESSTFVREYLNGEYGTQAELGPYTPSLFFALDRYSVAQKIQDDLSAGKIVLSNRFTGSNMAHQAVQLSTPAEREMFFNWLDQLEFGMLQIPRPDQNIVLLVPADIAQQLVDQKEARSYTSQKRDLHEADINHLTKAVEVYEELCKTFPENFSLINCTRKGELMSIPTINNLIWERIQPMLGRLRKKHNEIDEEPQGVFAPKKTINPYVKKNSNGRLDITNEGKEFLASSVTNSTGNVYAFTDKLSPVTIAAAMARLSRRSDDMRLTLLDEFAASEGKDEDLLKRVITAYGDDSVQQLTGVHLVVENASNLLTKKLEWGRLGAYLEQSTRYIFFDQKDEKGKYRYFLPTELKKVDAKHYCAQMDLLFEKYSELVHALTQHLENSSKEPSKSRDNAWKAAIRAQACDAARNVLPVATKSTVGIFASAQALESLIMHLQSDELLEARETGDTLLQEARKVIPVFLQRADKPDRGGGWVAQRVQTRTAMQKLVREKSLQPMKGGEAAVELTEFWPKNELDLVAHVLYEHSTLGLANLRITTGEWSYAEKESTLKTYIGERLNRRQKPGRAFEAAHYNFDLLCDYGIFRDLQRHRMVDALQWQQLTPHYGFETPSLVSEAGLDELYESCFELSMKLYQYLLESGYEHEAQYATLLGHRMRWKVMMNAREAYHFIELRTSPQGHPGYRKLVKQMYDKIAEVHPIIASGMVFVNKGEDPELTRLAAELAAQHKLKKLN